MKRFSNLFTIALIVCATLISTASAADKILSGVADTVTVATDKNGSEYVRVIIQEQRSLGGQTYTAGVPVMFFQDQLEAGKKITSGDTFKAIVAESDYNGQKSYTVRAVITE